MTASTRTGRAPQSRRRATVAIGFVTGMLSGMRARAMDPDPLLVAAGIDPASLTEADARVPVEAYAALYNAVVRALDDEGFALFSAPLRLGTFEFLCRSIMSSRTLEEALMRAARFLRLVLPDFSVTIERAAGPARIEIAERHVRLRDNVADPCRVFAFEWLLRLLHGLSCWLVGRGLSLDSVAFPYPKPPHAADYGLIYTERSSFDNATLVASLNPNLLDLPVRRDEEALAAFLEGAPGKLSMLYRRDRETVRRVRDILAAALPRALSLEEVAAELLLSPRTLHRRLHEEGSNLRAIKDALRRDLALARLEKTDHSVARIAADLGYAEPSAFFRAFQAWTGVAPTRYRARLTKLPAKSPGG